MPVGPAPAAAPAPTFAPPAPSAPSANEQRTDTGRIVLHVAQSAKVIINDRPTRLEGSERVFLSRLKPGETYRFRVQIEDRGEVVQRDVLLQAGETKTFQIQGTELAAL